MLKPGRTKTIKIPSIRWKWKTLELISNEKQDKENEEDGEEEDNAPLVATNGTENVWKANRYKDMQGILTP